MQLFTPRDYPATRRRPVDGESPVLKGPDWEGDSSTKPRSAVFVFISGNLDKHAANISSNSSLVWKASTGIGWGLAARARALSKQLGVVSVMTTAGTALIYPRNQRRCIQYVLLNPGAARQEALTFMLH